MIFGSADVSPVASLTLALRLCHGGEGIDNWALQHLLRSRRPVNHDAVDPLARAKSEVNAPVVLAGESGSAVDDATLGEIARLEHHLGADRAPVAASADETEPNPVAAAVRVVAVQDRRLVLIGDDDILRAATGEVGDCHGAAVVEVIHAYVARDVDPAGDAAIEIDPRSLVSR